MPHETFVRPDGSLTTQMEALDHLGSLRPGYRVGKILADGDYARFSMSFMDSASPIRTLRDASGQPTTLYDAATGVRFKLNTDLIAAIESEAAKVGMSVADYVESVLKYSWHAAKLAGHPKPGSPGEMEPE